MGELILEAIAQFAHDDGCGCWEGAPKGTPLPGLLNPVNFEALFAQQQAAKQQQQQVQ